MKKLNWSVATLLMSMFLWFPSFAAGQDAPDLMKEEVKLTRKIIKLKRKQIIAANMSLTPEEEKVFWPIYDKYISSISFVNDQKFKIIEDYRNGYINKNLSDETSIKLVEDYFKTERSRLNFKQLYIKRFKEVLPHRKVARFFQVDNKLDAAINFELAQGIPLIPAE